MNLKLLAISHLAVLVIGFLLCFLLCQKTETRIERVPYAYKDTLLEREIQMLEDSLSKIPIIVPGPAEADTDTVWVPPSALPYYEYVTEDSCPTYYDNQEHYPVFELIIRGYGTLTGYSIKPLKNSFYRQEHPDKNFDFTLFGSAWTTNKLNFDEGSLGAMLCYKKVGMGAMFAVYPVDDNLDYKVRFGVVYNIIKLRW